MTYTGALGGYQLPNGVGTPAQLATVLRLFAEDAAAADMGNVPAKYASMVLLPDGSLTASTSALVPDPGADWQPAYLAQVVGARRYLLIAVPRVMSNGQTQNWFTTIGAIGAPAASAILSTYTPAGTPTEKTPVAEAAAKAAAPAPATPTNQPAQASTAPPPVSQTAAPTLPTSLPAELYPASPAVIEPLAPPPPDDPTPAEPPSFLANIPSWALIGGAVLGGYLLLRRRS